MQEVGQEVATNKDLAPSKIAIRKINELPDYLKGRMNKLPSLKRFASRKSIKEHGQVPKNPKSLDVIVIPDEYRTIQTGDGEVKWLYYESPDVKDESRFFIFTTQKQLDVLNNAEHVFADGTFKVCILKL